MEKILRYFTKDKLLINLIIIVVILLGLANSRNINREIFPQTDVDIMIINIVYPGASAQDVELTTIIPIEEELNTINGIEEYRSIATDDGGKVVVELDVDLDESTKEDTKDEVFRSISQSNIEEIPDEVELIKVVDMNPKLKPIYTLSISAREKSNTGPGELYRMADVLEDNLRRVAGVSDVTKSGYREREIHIDVNPEKMKSYYVSLSEIIESIRSRNVRQTGGTIQSLHKENLIITIGQFADPMDVGEVIIRSGFEQKRLHVKDVASVKDDFEDEDVRVRVNRKKAVTLTINKKENADIISTVDNIEKFLNENKDQFNTRFDLAVVKDESNSIQSLIQVVISNALIGFVMILIVLRVFLDFRTSFWTAFSLPFSMLMVLIFMNSFGITLNILSMGAIITVLGMMVDDAIVIAEVIFEKRNTGMSPIEAAVTGVKEVMAPIIVTITSTIVAFLPILGISGIMGKLIRVYPIVIIATLLLSLFEAFFSLPNHLASGRPGNKKSGTWFDPLVKKYKTAVLRVLKIRYGVIVFLVISLTGVIIFSNETLKGFVLFWDNTSEEIIINNTAPPGTPLEDTERFTVKIEEMALKNIPDNELVAITSTIGTHFAKKMKLKGDQENWSTVKLQLVPITKRQRTAAEIIEDLRSYINTGEIPEFDLITIEEQQMGPPTGSAVDVKVVSAKEAHAKAVTAEIKEFLSGVKGVKDVEDDQKPGKDEIILDFNYDKMAQYGITVATVAYTVRTAFDGTIATYVQYVDDDIDFKVQVGEKFKKDPAFILDLLIPNNMGKLIRLGEIADIKKRESGAFIIHYNGDRVITVTANVNEDQITSGQVTRMLKEKFKNIPKKYDETFLVYAGKSKESRQALKDLAIAFGIALVAIYLLIVFLFRSITQPFIVISVIPFGLIGVLLAFTFHGIPLNFMGIIGIIGLSGVVANDSILMVEFINREYRNKKTPDREVLIEQIADGAKQRLRPIILTTITTVAALLPTVYGIGGNAASIVPTVMAMAYGLLFASLLTLFLVPSLYLINIDIVNAGNKLGSGAGKLVQFMRKGRDNEK